MDESVIDTVKTLEDTGKKQYQDFVRNVLEDRTRSIHEPIKRNSLVIFKKPNNHARGRRSKFFRTMSNFLVNCTSPCMQNREEDLSEFFPHEIQFFPPSLSDFGNPHLPSTKSELLYDILSSLNEPSRRQPTIASPGWWCHRPLPSDPTTAVSTFNEYADRVFIPYLEKQLQESRRLDVVWDTYIPDSLKESTRFKRGKGVGRKVSGQTKLPAGNWMDFLRDSTNKKELFTFLTTNVDEFNYLEAKVVYVISGQSVLSISSGIPMPSCNHEEADTRVVVHVLHALEQGQKIVLVRTVATLTL